MTTAFHAPPQRRRKTLQEASLLEGPMLLLKSIRGFSSNRAMTWLACAPLALMGLGIFTLSAKAEELPELSAAFLANNLWLLVATILVIFMNAGFAMVEAGMCRQKNAVNILAKNLFVFALAVTAYWFVGYSLMYGTPSLAAGCISAASSSTRPSPLRPSAKPAWFPPLISCSRRPSPEPQPRSFPVLWLSGSSSANS